MYLVITEWDGDKPPTRYYDRLHRLGLFVRGGKDKSPLDRRAKSDGSVIVQEGAIMCASESLAHALASYATTDGATLVQMAEVDITEKAYKMTPNDVETMARINSVFSKRGRPSKEDIKVDWVVTCLEEMKTFTVPQQAAVVSCPNCRGFNIRTRIGTLQAYKYPTTGDPLSRFLRFWFAGGYLEKPDEDAWRPEPPPAPVIILNPKDQEVVDLIQKSPDFMHDLDIIATSSNYGDTYARMVVERLFHARAHKSKENRELWRIRAIAAVLKQTQQQDTLITQIPLTEREDAVDLFDLSSTMDIPSVANIFRLAHP